MKVKVKYILTHRKRKENDIVILSKKSAQDKVNSKLTKPLKIGGTVQTHRGKFLHEDIIGSNIRDVVKSSAGKIPFFSPPQEFKVQENTEAKL